VLTSVSACFSCCRCPGQTVAGASYCTGAGCNTTGDCCSSSAGSGLSVDGSTCGTCPEGHFNNGTSGTGKCQACPLGQYADTPGASGCTVCSKAFTNGGTTCFEGGFVWRLGGEGLSCTAACAAQAEGALLCYGESAFKEVVTAAYFNTNVKGGVTCSGTSSSTDSGAPFQYGSSCYYGSNGDCTSTYSDVRPFCACSCPAGQYSDTGSTAACKT
jgi:hypothetical protein